MPGSSEATGPSRAFVPGEPQAAGACFSPCPDFAAAALASLGLILSVPESFPPLPAQRAVVRGDSLFPSIAAASILAKTARDAVMEQLDAVFPGYGFAIHKGYGTAAHLEALETQGPCVLHRQTFRKVRPEERQLSLL